MALLHEVSDSKGITLGISRSKTLVRLSPQLNPNSAKWQGPVRTMSNRTRCFFDLINWQSSFH